MKLPTVKQLTAHYEKAEDHRHQFVVKHGFVTLPRFFKNCIVIRWENPTLMRKHRNGESVSTADFEEYAQICKALYDKYKVIVSRLDWFMDSDLKLAKMGIYRQWGRRCQIWAIPNEYAEVQKDVLALLPKWAKVTYK